MTQTSPSNVDILGDSFSGSVGQVGSASAIRAVDLSGIYAEITVRVENGRWGGRMGNRLVIYPRPTVPINVQVFTSDWVSVGDLAPSDALSYALDQVTTQACEWVSRFVSPLPVDSR